MLCGTPVSLFLNRITASPPALREIFCLSKAMFFAVMVLGKRDDQVD